MPKSAIGLDINDTSICAVELRATAEGLRLARSASVPAPAGSFHEGSIVQPKVVAKAVRRLLRSGRINVGAKRVAVALCGKAVVTRITELPSGGPSAVREHFREEIKRYAVLRGDATVSDFVVLGPLPGKEEGPRALLAAVREAAADKLVETLVRAGLEPAAIDVFLLASARSVHAKCLTEQPSAAVALAVVESQFVHLMVVQAGTIPFMHTSAGPVNILQDAAAGVPAFASEVRSVLDFYGTEMGSRKDVQKLVVCVGQGVPSDFATGLSHALDGLAVEVCSPSSIVEDAGLLEGGIQGRPTPCAVGLAMRAINGGASPLSLDLLPEKTDRVQTLKKRALLTAILAAVLFLVSVLCVGAIHLRVRKLESETAGVRENLASFARPVSAQQVRAEIAMASEELEGQRAFLHSAGLPISWSKVLSDIKGRIPKEVRLTSLRADSSGGLTIEGESFSVDAVYRFVEVLRRSEHVRSAQLSSVEAEDDRKGALSKYEIDCELRAAGSEKE